VALRLGLVGGGWISGHHLEAFAKVGRTELVGVVSRMPQTADAVVARWGGMRFDDLEAMLDRAKPDLVVVAVPPHLAVGLGERLVDRGIPFLIEKPLAASDASGPARLATAIERAGIVVAVGYHLRALDLLPELRDRLSDAPPHLVLARWLDSTPQRPWWGRVAQGGGQVVEQATHLYDLARLLLGEANVIGAASTRDILASPRGVDVADSTAAVLRFQGGAIGSFANSRRLKAPVIEMEFVSEGSIATLEKREDRGQGDWHLRFDDGTSVRARRAETDPYQTQAMAFIDAVQARDPGRVLSTYADALKTDHLTRAVVAATGAPG
jgi:myo-inositol 2-dehydrogenase/D-chiro-inositol 1-dehydrogenase